MTQTVLITGASGKIGRHAAKAFTAAGWDVRLFKRGTDMTQAARGADVIVNGMNPPNYHDWKTLIPQITREVIADAKASGATVIIPGNVYNYGANTDGIWDETTPHAPVTRKGRIREEMEAAYRASGVRTIILRAGNFIDPDSGDDVMSALSLRGLPKGRFTFAGDPDARQSWCYVPDWAEAARQLAERRASLAAFEDVPFAGYTLTGRQLQARVEAITGQTLRGQSFPWWAMRLASPVLELARELGEMRYLFDLDHGLSGEKLAELLPGFRATPLDAALAAKLGETGAARAA